MRRALTQFCTGLFLLTLSSTAVAGEGIVIWLEEDVPDVKARTRAENLSGASVHLAHVDLAFPPMPAQPEDAERIEALRVAIADGKARWDEFDIELTIAREIEGAMAPITLIRDRRDLQDIVDARLFQGAAVQKAFTPDMFATDEDAKPFRKEFPGLTGNAPWLHAMALDGARDFTRADLADGSSFPDLQALKPAFEALPAGTLDIRKLPEGAVLVVDGREVEATDGRVKLRPGIHYSHVIRNDRVSGRQMIEITPGQTSALPMLVDVNELEQARRQVLQGLTTGLPDDVKASIEELSNHHSGPIFIAGLDEKGRVAIVPYARGAQLFKEKPITVTTFSELGGGVIISSLFNDADGSLVTAPALMGSMGMELGIYNFALVGGADLSLIPVNTVTYGKANGTGDAYTSVLPSTWVGAGAYVLRPSGNTPTLLLAGTFGYNYPAHLAFGGRLALGVPVGDEGTWFRIALGGSGSGRSMWDGDFRDIAMYQMYLRFGLSARL